MYCELVNSAVNELYFLWPFSCKYKLRKKKEGEEQEPTVFELMVVVLMATHSDDLYDLVLSVPELFWFLALNVQHVAKMTRKVGGNNGLKPNARAIHMMKNSMEEKGNKYVQNVASRVVST